MEILGKKFKNSKKKSKISTISKTSKKKIPNSKKFQKLKKKSREFLVSRPSVLGVPPIQISTFDGNFVQRISANNLTATC
jgi:hypothetical protein